jgi:transketolase
MRTAFIESLCEVAEANPKVWLLTGDLGFSVLERFAARFPDRYVNVGVAEQNLTAVAAGLALTGKTVFTYSIANFPVMRCLEQVRNDVCYHNLNVKIVAVGGGVAYGAAGYSHHAVEDLAIMRALPNLTVLAPGDPAETRLATKAIVTHDGPCYLRLGKAQEAVVHARAPEFVLGRAIGVREGNAGTLISTGGILSLASDVAATLAGDGLPLRLISMPTVQPLDVAAVLAAARDTGCVFTLEEHRGGGGLGGAVAEVLAEAGLGIPFKRFFLHDDYLKLVGSQSFLRAGGKLGKEHLMAEIRKLLAAVGRRVK